MSAKVDRPEAHNDFGSADNVPTYWLTRYLILRLCGAIYAIAFLVAVNQIIPLIGTDGLLPVGSYLRQVREALGSSGAGFWHLPSVFWLWHSDAALLTVSWIGLLLSLVVIVGYVNMPVMAVIWFLYMSIVHAGQEWYSYGWEIQLSETGFLAIFLCPLWEMRPFPRRPPPLVIIILFRWLICRIMLGAGLIKYRGDASWLNGTALYSYFETQPIPGPFTRWFHFLPHAALKVGVWFNWLAELIAPWFSFGPRLARHLAGMVMVLLQISIIISGNLSFLNWLTIIPAVACFDDGFLKKLFPQRMIDRAAVAAEQAEESRGMTTTTWAVTALVGLLSVQPALNLLSSSQVMNNSYDPFDLVNTYGAFGSVGTERMNVVFEGTMSARPDSTADWKPYIYKGLPVLLDKRPVQIAPYQLHLDWQMWFAAMSPADQYSWAYFLAWKLLHHNENAIGLFAGDPFNGKTPRYVRAILYRYEFARPGNPQGHYWNRHRLGEWMPALAADDPGLIAFLKSRGWLP